jgi:hypothetical protein
MAIVKNKDSQENREFWSHVETVANDVRTWPQWMGNQSGDKTNTSEASDCSKLEEKSER